METALDFRRSAFASHYSEDQFMVNTDYVMSMKHTFSQRYFYSNQPQNQPFRRHDEYARKWRHSHLQQSGRHTQANLERQHPIC